VALDAPDVLALRALGLGDLLTAVPALRALQDTGARVTVAAPPPLRPLVALVGCDHLPARALAPLPPRAHGARLLVNLHGRGPQSHAVAMAARPQRLIAFHHPDVPVTRAMPEWRDGEHEVARWCRLLEESGLPADPARLTLERPPLPPALELARGATVIHPGAASPARRWPAARFAEVAAQQPRCVITGGPDERTLARDVARIAGLDPRETVLAGRTDLMELAAVVAHARRVVCGDTGVAHLATAFGVPSVVLFGPTPPSEWGPLTAGDRHRVLWAGRTGDPHAATPHEGLLRITPRDVLTELSTLETTAP
jgi:ADP-heptose:LPS heptosyltransferase